MPRRAIKAYAEPALRDYIVRARAAMERRRAVVGDRFAYEAAKQEHFDILMEMSGYLGSCFFPEPPPGQVPVIDLMDALKRSLASGALESAMEACV